MTEPEGGEHKRAAEELGAGERLVEHLTETGRDVMDEAMAEHVLTEQRLVASLDEHERAQLAALLRKLLQAIETE